MHSGAKIQEAVLENGKVKGLKFIPHGQTEPTVLDVDMVAGSALSWDIFYLPFYWVQKTLNPKPCPPSEIWFRGVRSYIRNM